jgi:hypothetical protein
MYGRREEIYLAEVPTRYATDPIIYPYSSEKYRLCPA